MLSRPNGELTRAGQYYYQLIGRPPPSRQYDRNQPLIREGPNDYIMLRGGAKKLLRSLQPNGNYQLTKLGTHFFKDKWVDWVVHVPVIIRGVRRNGRNRGMPYERTKRLPVTDLNVALSRQSEGLSDAQAARNLKASVLAQLGNPEPNDIILELSDESYYLDATREWTFSQQAMQVVDDQVVVDTVLDQPLGALRDVSYQLFCGDEILESAFEQRPDKLCVARQLAELMRLPVQEVLSDFDAITNGSKWREQGITPREIRSFCVWRQAPMFYVDCQGRLQGAAGRGLHELERPRLLLQIRPHRREVRADRGPGPGQIPGREEARRNAGVQGLVGVGGRGRQRPLLRRGPGAGPEGAPGRGALPQGGHAEHERVAVPAPEGARRRGLRHLRLPRGPGGAAGLDGPAGAPLSRAAPGGRGERGLPSPAQGAPGSARVSPVQALRGAHHRGDVRAGPHRPRAPVLLRTGPEPPGPVPRVPPEQNGPGVLARHDAGVPLPCWCLAKSQRANSRPLGCGHVEMLMMLLSDLAQSRICDMVQNCRAQMTRPKKHPRKPCPSALQVESRYSCEASQS